MLEEKVYSKPFLKWAGGKRQLLEQFEEKFPDSLKENKINRYIEPFVGGGAVFFELINRYDFDEVVLNDINEELIITYKVVRDHVDILVSMLKELEERYHSLDLKDRKKIYYSIRDTFNQEKKLINYNVINNDAIIHACHFIFLNRTCFNGLYRQNKKGEFNVPIGSYKMPTICDEENLHSVSINLKGVKLVCGDFEDIEKFVDFNTLIYIDPPYRPLPNTPSFNKYSKANFNEKSQERLANWYRDIDDKFQDKNIYLMLSNSNPKNNAADDNFFDILYSGFRIDEVYAKRSINSKANKRGEITELLIRNY